MTGDANRIHGRSQNRRRWRRHVVLDHGAVTLTAEGRRCPCDIEDISLGGVRLRLRGPLPHSFEVRLEHPVIGYVYGQRAWAGSDAIGIELDLSPRALRLLAHYLGAVPAPSLRPDLQSRHS